MKIAGLDIGTTGCKLTVFDEKGQYLDKAYRDYPVSRDTFAHEVDATAILDGVWAVLSEMGKKYPDITGIGITSFGETFVLTNEKGVPLHKAMLYTDPRGSEECEQLVEALGSMEIAAITGLKPHTMYSISKMMWIKKHLPNIYQQAKHAFLMEDYIVYALTGKAQIDYSLASRTMAFDIVSLQWSKEIFAAADVNISLMSEAVPTGTPAGTILPEAAKKTGLSEETIIVSVSHDQVSAAVGVGAFGSETAVDGAGTVECVTHVFDHLPKLEVMYQGNYSIVPYVIPGTYVSYAFSYTGGALMQWCVDTLAAKEKELAGAQGVSVNELLESGYDGPTGLLVLPHFAGAATPYMDTGSKGAVIGLTIGSTLPDIYKACMEGVVYEMMLNEEYLKGTGMKPKMLHATGGGARSKVWMQMKADALGIPITALATMDAGTVGSAMLTGIAAGCFRDIEDAREHMVEKMEIYEPRQELHKEYASIYKRYRMLYEAVRPLVEGGKE